MLTTLVCGHDGTTRRNLLTNSQGSLGVAPAAASSYRTAVNAADFLATPVITSSADAGDSGGGLGTSTVLLRVIAGNATGQSLPSAEKEQETGSGEDYVVIENFTVTGATYYDIYVKVTSGAPKFLVRLTAAQVAAGCRINGTTISQGFGAGKVHVGDEGAGTAYDAIATYPRAFVMPAATPVDCTGFRYVDFDLTFTPTAGSATAPALTVIPFFGSAADGWAQGTPFSPEFASEDAPYNCFSQRTRVEVRGSQCHLLVANIAGGTVNISAVKS